MSISLSDNALIIPTDVVEAALDGMEIDISALDSDSKGEIKGICNTVGQIIEEDLGRNLHVHTRTLYIPSGSWKTSRDTTYSFETWLEDWPLIEVTSDTTVVLGEVRPGGQLIFSDEKHESITGFIGYMRHDETLAKVKLLTGLSALTATPSVLPALVRDTALAAAHHLVEERISGRFSGNRKVQGIGTGSVTVEASDRNHMRRLLRRLHAYKRRNG